MAVPSGCFTRTCSQEWGLVHSILVIVPLKFTGLLASNSAAKAWCADVEDAHPKSARPMMETAIASFVRIISSRCAFVVGRNRFIAPPGEAKSIVARGEADGAIKRLRPTVCFLMF